MRAPLLFILLLLLPSCAIDARNDVLRNVSQTHASDEHSPAVIRDPAIDAYMNDLGEQVLASAKSVGLTSRAFRSRAKNTSHPLYPYDDLLVRVVHSEKPNATTPGDDVARISTAMILQAESPEEICAVLCHEIGHMMHQHAFEERERWHSQEFGANSLIVMGTMVDVAGAFVGIPGSTATSAAMNSKAGARANYSPFRKTDELEADAIGYRIYRDMGLDPFLYDDFLMRTLANYGDGDSPSHPRPSRRVQKIRAMRLAEEGYTVERRLNQSDFITMQRRLASILSKPGVERTTDEAVVAHLSYKRGGAPFFYACGAPLPASDERIRANYTKALRKHAERLP